MRVALASFVALFLLIPLGSTQEKQERDAIKWDMSYLEKTWGIQFKSGTAAEDGKQIIGGSGFVGTVKEGKQIKMLLAFSKDVPDAHGLFKALYPPGTKPGKENVWFFFFDEDNVVLGQAPVTALEGQLTGKKGDAFRLYLIPPTEIKKIRKVEARSIEPSK